MRSGAYRVCARSSSSDSGGWCMRSIGRALGTAVIAITVLFWAFTRLTVIADGGDAPRSAADETVVKFLVMPAPIVAPADALDGDAVDWQAVALEALARADNAEREQRACELARLEHAYAE